MNSSRTALIAMLIAVEVFLLGLMVSALGGGSWSGVHTAGFDHVDASAKTFPPLVAGSAPHVLIDDADSAVLVNASQDGLVHVTDESHVHGLVFGVAKFAPLAVTRTSDGVRIVRAAHDGNGGIIGMSVQRIVVQVPSGAHVDIVRASSAEIRGMRNAVDAVSQDGHISLADIQGNVRAHSDDGHIDANDLRGTSIVLSTNDGHMSLRNISAQTLDVKTGDGRIDANDLAIAGSSAKATLRSEDGSVHASGRFAASGNYDFSTADGRIELALVPASDLTIAASTQSGHINVDGSSYGDGDAATQTIHLGNGSGAMRLATQDGSIRIRTNGAL